MSVIRNTIPRLSSWTGSLAGWLMVVISFMMGYDILLQLILRHGTIWVYEISGYGLFWFSFLSSGFVLLKNRHIHVEILISHLNAKTEKVIQAGGYLLIILFLSAMSYYTFHLSMTAFATHERSSTLVQAPMSYVYLGGAVGLAVFLIQSVFSLIELILQSGKQKERIQWIPSLILLAAFILGIALWFSSPILGLLIMLVVMLIGGVPIFATLGVVGSLGLVFLSGLDQGLPQIAQIAFKALDNSSLLAIPLFILAGVILQKGNIGPEIYQFATAWLGHIRGGFGIATVLACGIFAAISGSSVATCAAIGIIAIPEMIRRKYRPLRVYGLLAGGGTLGILIPPSTPMILYSGMTDESTGQLFMGGVFPGLLVMLLFAVWNFIIADKGTVAEKYSLKARLLATRNAIWGVILPFLIILGIYFGLLTPTQAGAAAVIYAFIVSLARKKITVRDMPAILAEGTLSSGMILMIIAGALMLGQVVTLLQIPDNLLNFINQSGMSTWAVMLSITFGYMILGMFMEVVSVMLITLPVVYPLIISLGINGLWFGVYLTMLMELALITPPVGLNLFVIKDISKSSINQVVRGSASYFLLLAVVIIIIIFFPQLVLWLPGRLIG